MSSLSKRQGTYSFNIDGEEPYCFGNLKGKCVCLLCDSSVAVAKKHNVEAIHATFNSSYPFKSALRRKKISDLKSNMSAQQPVFTRPVVKSKNATTASLKTSLMLSLQDGELLKETFLIGADCLFD